MSKSEAISRVKARKRFGGLVLSYCPRSSAVLTR